MNYKLKENVSHGTKEFPYTRYHIQPDIDSFQMPIHWHDELEIIYIKKGPLYVSINEQDYYGESGSIYIINPHDLHYMFFEHRGGEYVTLLFPLEFLSFQTKDDLETLLFAPLRNGEIHLRHEITSQRLHKRAIEILEMLIGLSRAITLSNQILTRVYLLMFFEILISDSDMLMKAPISAGTELQRKLLTYIQEHFTDKIMLSDLSERFHLSEKYISRYFKEHFNITFTNYVNYLRLSEARKLLDTTNLPITELAMQCGFPNVSYFIRSFKKYYGIAPLQYRNRKTNLSERS